MPLKISPSALTTSSAVSLMDSIARLIVAMGHFVFSNDLKTILWAST
jgi:hypothetical protein